jgi:hypothetical protein
MIRATAIASLVVALVLALYLPSAHPPSRFLAHLKADHVAAAKLWGMERAGQMLDGALTTLESAPRQPPGLATSSNGALDTAVSKEMSTVGQRLFDNAYVRSIEALLAMSLFRIGLIVHSLPWLVHFIAATLMDGQLSRLRKAREFRQHDPERFAIAMTGTIVVACGTFTALLMPLDVPVLVWAAAPLVAAWLFAGALACFHYRW